MTTLEKLAELNSVNENIIENQKRQLAVKDSINSNNEKIIDNYKNTNTELGNINTVLKKDVELYKKRSRFWPVWLSSGVIIGTVLCLSVK